MKYRHAFAAAAGVTIVMAIAGLVTPPSLYSDQGWGFLALRGWQQGAGFNVVRAPHPADISTNIGAFQSWWSPGQYLLPALFMELGTSTGTALTMATTVSLLSALVGWICLLREFGASARAALIAVLALGFARYSTLPFGIYNGGEVLLQGALPWLIIVAWLGCRAPFARGLLGGALIVAVAFFAKLSGLMAAVAALGAAAIHSLASARRLSAGVAGVAVGSSCAGVALLVYWLSNGQTPATAGRMETVAVQAFYLVASSIPSGLAIGDVGAWLLLHPSRPFGLHPAVVGLVSLVPASLLVWIIADGRRGPGAAASRSLRPLLLTFGSIYLLTLLLYVLWGGAMSLDERHLRPTGIALLVLAIVVATDGPAGRARRVVMFGMLGTACLYGAASYGQRAWSVWHSDRIDNVSGTVQPNISQEALEFVRSESLRRGPAAILVLPSPEIAVALPWRARILATHIDFEPSTIYASRQYEGRSPGGIVVAVQGRLADTDKGRSLRRMFVAYADSEWVRNELGSTTVFVTE